MTTFTVVIATKNRADLLPRAVRSVLEQSMADLEVIVSDDGSTDDTRAVVEGIDDDRLRYVSGDSGGPSAARNRGAAHAVGDFIAFLDDDDEASPGWLEAFLAPLAAENCAAVCCGAEKLLPDGSRTVELPRDLGPAFGDRTGLFLCGTFVLRRSAFDELGGYTESLRWSEQTDLALRLCTRADELGWDIVCVQAPLITYHQALPLERSSKVPRRWPGPRTTSCANTRTSCRVTPSGVPTTCPWRPWPKRGSVSSPMLDATSGVRGAPARPIPRTWLGCWPARRRPSPGACGRDEPPALGPGNARATCTSSRTGHRCVHAASRVRCWPRTRTTRPWDAAG